MKIKNLFCLPELTDIPDSTLAVEKIIHFSSGNNTITGTLTQPEHVNISHAVLIKTAAFRCQLCDA